MNKFNLFTMRNFALISILTGILLIVVGSALKINHTSGADTVLIVGMLVEFIGFGLLLVSLFTSADASKTT
jgi:hypothetical protein